MILNNGDALLVYICHNGQADAVCRIRLTILESLRMAQRKQANKGLLAKVPKEESNKGMMALKCQGSSDDILDHIKNSQHQ